MFKKLRRFSFGGAASSSAVKDHPFPLPSTPTFSSKDFGSLVDIVAPPSKPPLAASPILHRTRTVSGFLRRWKAPAPTETKIVLYYTSLRIVRKTFQECRAVRSILNGYRVMIDERDLSMDSSFLTELKGILKVKKLTLPQVFIGGRYVGGFEEVQALNESGELKKLIEGVPTLKDNGVCETCGGMRFILCRICDGSRKIYLEKRSIFRHCGGCNENGLVRCMDCC